MFPVLFSIFGISFYTASAIIAIGFLISLFFFWKLIRIEIVEEEKIFDFIVATILGSLFFGRILYIFENFNDFQFKIDRMIHLYKYPGLSFWGLAFGGLIVGFYFLHRIKTRAVFFLDVFSVCMSLFLSFVFASFFFDGHYAGLTNNIIGVSFIGLVGRRLPIQLPASFLFFMFFIFNKSRAFKKQKGFIFWSFITFTFVIFLALEFLRQDRIYFEGIVINKFMFFLVALFSSAIIFIKYKERIKTKLSFLNKKKAPKTINL